jgi:carbon-monoxide dehydrogenase medium subunit
MFPAEFTYHRAGSIADASRLLKDHPGAKLLAGGHSLIPLMKLRLAAPEAIIDIGRIAEMRGIDVAADRVRIGALTTHADLAASEALRRVCPMLAQAAALVGDPQVRNRGTIGGNVAHADPASDLPTVLAALDATFVAVGPGGERRIGAADFFQGLMSTALADDEVLVAIEVPTAQAGEGARYEKFTHPASRYAVIGVAAAIVRIGGKCASARIAAGGLVPRPVRLRSVEASLAGSDLSPDAVAAGAERAGDDLGDDVIGDLFASAEYRRATLPVHVRRAILAAQ